MAAINGANRGLGLVTLGLETDFPEAERNTNPGTVNVRTAIAFKIENVDYIGTAAIGSEMDPDSPLLIESVVDTSVRKYGAKQ